MADRVKHWLSMGAKATGTVHNMLINHKIITGKKVNVLPKKTYTKPEEAPKAEAPAVAPAPEETPVAEEAPAPAPEAPAEPTA